MKKVIKTSIAVACLTGSTVGGMIFFSNGGAHAAASRPSLTVRHVSTANFKAIRSAGTGVRTVALRNSHVIAAGGTSTSSGTTSSNYSSTRSSTYASGSGASSTHTCPHMSSSSTSGK